MFNELLARVDDRAFFSPSCSLASFRRSFQPGIGDSTYSLSPVSKMDIRCVVVSAPAISFA